MFDPQQHTDRSGETMRCGDTVRILKGGDHPGQRALIHEFQAAESWYVAIIHIERTGANSDETLKTTTEWIFNLKKICDGEVAGFQI